MTIPVLPLVLWLTLGFVVARAVNGAWPWNNLRRTLAWLFWPGPLLAVLLAKRGFVDKECGDPNCEACLRKRKILQIVKQQTADEHALPIADNAIVRVFGAEVEPIGLEDLLIRIGECHARREMTNERLAQVVRGWLAEGAPKEPVAQ